MTRIILTGATGTGESTSLCSSTFGRLALRPLSVPALCRSPQLTTAGSAILTNALASPLISHVTVLARRAPAVKSDKLTTILVPSDEYPKGFDELPPSLVERLRGNDAAIWALGISQTQVSKEEFNR